MSALLIALIFSIGRQIKISRLNKKLATTDELTKVYNRRYIMDIGGKEFTRAGRYKEPFSVLILDIDYFKTVNDKYGHGAGDKVLQYVTKTCLEQLRETDVFGRIGGEEFLVIFPHTNIDDTYKIAQRLRKAIESLQVGHIAHNLKVSISGGCSQLENIDASIHELIARADNALYEAKQCGRNRICIAKTQQT